MICHAHRTNGEPCKAKAMVGQKVCRVHGGATPKGIASPHYKHGRQSKYAPSLPPRMREHYENAINDPQLLEQHKEIGLVEARLIDLLKRVDTGESGAIWQALKTARMDLLVAQRGNSTIDQTKAINRILMLIDRGHTDYRAWQEVGNILEQRRKLVESERKRLIELRTVVSSEQAMGLVSALLFSVKEHITDRKILSAIQNDFIRFTSHQAEVIDVTPGSD